MASHSRSITLGRRGPIGLVVLAVAIVGGMAAFVTLTTKPSYTTSTSGTQQDPQTFIVDASSTHAMADPPTGPNRVVNRAGRIVWDATGPRTNASCIVCPAGIVSSIVRPSSVRTRSHVGSTVRATRR